MERLYKTLGHNGESVNGGSGTWNRHGKWMPPIEGELVACKNGYHLCRKKDLVHWLGPTIWEANYKGERLDANDKVVVREARLIRRLDNWDETTARLFAVDCAERVMHLGDEVIISAVLATTYLYAIGEVTRNILDAARDAAWPAAMGAARDAARGAAWVAAGAAAMGAAWDAARYAARDAAWYAAWYAARYAARDAEREWQTERLFEYLGGE